MTSELLFRPACIDPEFPEKSHDVLCIWNLLNIYAEKKLLLPRTKQDLAEKIGNFMIAEIDGKFAGCGALRNYGNGLFEVRSLAVLPEFSGRGIGSGIVEKLVRKALEENPLARIFALTYRTGFFQHAGFRIADKNMFPDKIWSDCILCSKKDHCDETAVLLEANR